MSMNKYSVIMVGAELTEEEIDLDKFYEDEPWVKWYEGWEGERISIVVDQEISDPPRAWIGVKVATIDAEDYDAKTMPLDIVSVDDAHYAVTVALDSSDESAYIDKDRFKLWLIEYYA